MGVQRVVTKHTHTVKRPARPPGSGPQTPPNNIFAQKPNKTNETENGKIAVTIIPGLTPRKMKLRLKTKKDAYEKLLISSPNLPETYIDSSYICSIWNSSGND